MTDADSDLDLYLIRCIRGVEYDHPLTYDEAWSELYERYFPRLCRLLRSRGLDALSAEDSAQDAMVSVFRNINRYQHRPPATFRGWVVAIATNRGRSQWRLTRRRETKLTIGSLEKPDGMEENGGTYEPPATSFSPEATLMLANFKKSLPPDDARLFTAFFEETESVAEVAAALGLSHNAVYQRKFRLRERVRRYWREQR